MTLWFNACARNEHLPQIEMWTHIHTNRSLFVASDAIDFNWICQFDISVHTLINHVRFRWMECLFFAVVQRGIVFDYYYFTRFMMDQFQYKLCMLAHQREKEAHTQFRVRFYFSLSHTSRCGNSTGIKSKSRNVLEFGMVFGLFSSRFDLFLSIIDQAFWPGPTQM